MAPSGCRGKSWDVPNEPEHLDGCGNTHTNTDKHTHTLTRLKASVCLLPFLQTPDEYRDAYLAQLGSEVNHMHGFAYDAVWLAATAISHMMETAKLWERQSRNGSVSDEKLHQLLLDGLRGAQFRGVTVRTCTHTYTHTQKYTL